MKIGRGSKSPDLWLGLSEHLPIVELDHGVLIQYESMQFIQAPLFFSIISKFFAIIVFWLVLLASGGSPESYTRSTSIVMWYEWINLILYPEGWLRMVPAIALMLKHTSNPCTFEDSSIAPLGIVEVNIHFYSHKETFFFLSCHVLSWSLHFSVSMHATLFFLKQALEPSHYLQWSVYKNDPHFPSVMKLDFSIISFISCVRHLVTCFRVADKKQSQKCRTEYFYFK